MDQKYIVTTMALPQSTVDLVAKVVCVMQEKTGITKLSRRQVIEACLTQWLKANPGNED